MASNGSDGRPSDISKTVPEGYLLGDGRSIWPRSQGSRGHHDRTACCPTRAAHALRALASFDPAFKADQDRAGQDHTPTISRPARSDRSRRSVSHVRAWSPAPGRPACQSARWWRHNAVETGIRSTYESPMSEYAPRTRADHRHLLCPRSSRTALHRRRGHDAADSGGRVRRCRRAPRLRQVHAPERGRRPAGGLGRSVKSVRPALVGINRRAGGVPDTRR